MIKFEELMKELGTTKLVVVSKKRSKEQIMHYYNLGQRMFGENRAEELLTKVDLPKDIEWHFIGHLQRNKVRKIISYLSCIESVESLDLVKILDQEAKRINRVIPILIQFNFAKESTKKGLNHEDAIPFITECLNYENIKVRGIMCMGPHTDNTQQIEAVFEEAQRCFLELQNHFGKELICECSMGMSDDYPLALHHGSTMVRIGSKLFE